MRFLIIFLLFIPAFLSAQEVQTIVWNKYPLKVSLPVGKERIISFTKPTQLQLPADLLDKIEYTILEGTHYYLKANQDIPQQRVFATSNSGEQIIIELSARKSAPSSMLSIVSSADAVQDINQAKDQVSTPPPALSVNDIYIRMAQFASQQLYAPSRLIKPNPDLVRVKVIDKAQPILKEKPEIEAMPWAQWKSKSTGLHITAIKLTNKANYGVSLDPRYIRGSFQTAILQHGFLTSAKHPESVSALFVVSKSSFEEALGPWAIN